MRSQRRRVLRWLAALGLVVVGAGTFIAIGPLAGRATPHPTDAASAYPTSLATVTQGPLSSQVNVSASLGYAGSYAVVDEASGIVTSVPTAGEVIREGQVLFGVDESPVVLLYGSIPAYRTLSRGMRGHDVAELNAALVALGDATRGQEGTSDAFSWATVRAVEQLQSRVGLDRTGQVTLGEVIFLPSAVRITNVTATLGDPTSPGQVLMQATSTDHEVIIALDAAQQSEVKDGDHVAIALPDGATTSGVISRVGSVVTQATNAGGSGTIGAASGGSGTPSIEVDVTLADLTALGSLDQAPVQVSITTATVRQALTVPVDALLATADGGYIVEVVSRGVHRFVSVRLGLFDDANGMVQISGAVAAGAEVVVPTI